MNHNTVRLAVVAAAVMLGSSASAQQTAAIDFKSVGRAAPLQGMSKPEGDDIFDFEN